LAGLAAYARAGFGGGNPAESLNAAAFGTDASQQQSYLTAPPRA
jgi:hypothetical protein